MATNRFRHIDVDQLDEERYHDVTSDSASLGPNKQQVQELLMARNNAGALKACLEETPSAKNANEAVKVVVEVLTSFKTSEISPALKSLSIEEVDLLMKYIYKGMEAFPNSGGQLLVWHDKTLEKGGKGCIIRAIISRKF